MKTSFEKYPVSGADCCRALNSMANHDEVWQLKRIETLTNEDSTKLGELWQRVRMGSVELTTSELCEVLILAFQVITLDLVKKSDNNIQFLIEDGTLYSD